MTGRYRRCTSWLCYFGLAARVWGCPGVLGGRLITKSDIIDFEDTTQGGEAKYQNIREGRSRRYDVLIEESSQGSKRAP